MSAAETTSSGASLAERIIVIFLVAAAIALGYVYFFVIRAKAVPAPERFDLKNTMLDAEVGECVVLDTTPAQGGVVCVRVRNPGLVVRPRGGPARLGLYRNLKRARPYLACAYRYPSPGKGCADGEGHQEMLLYDLNAFGMPHDLSVALDGITPRWVKRGGRYLFVYEAQLTQYGRAPATWFVSLHHTAPITGAVLRRLITERQAQQTLFTPEEVCR